MIFRKGVMDSNIIRRRKDKMNIHQLVTNMKYRTLFQPMNIGECEISNRVVMSPAHLGLANVDGTLSERFMDYYEERAKAGTGLIIMEITRVNDKHGATSFLQPAISQDYHIPSMKEFADRIHKHGTKLFVQLHHPGRQNLGIMVNTVPLTINTTKVFKSFPDMLFKVAPTVGRKMDEKRLVFSSVAPSKCEMSEKVYSRVRAFHRKEIKKLIREFIDGAARCQKAGVDGVELHAAHGYLIQQFLSPNTNFRTDEYGGSFENRLRFLKEIIEGIRQECGREFPIIVRLSVDECYDRINKAGKGYGLDMGLKYAKALEKMEIDAIDVSSAAYDTWNYWLEPTSFDCGWRAYMAKAVKEVVSIPVLAANLIRSAEQAEKQLNEGIQDFVSLGRPHIADAHWTKKVLDGREDEIKRCIGCLNCIETTLEGAFAGVNGTCAVNPTVGKEKEYYNLPRNGLNRKVVIVGAGVSGLTAAELLGKRGFKPIVLEKNAQPGGQIQLANKPPKKEKLGWCTEDLAANAEKAGAAILYHTKADHEIIASYSPYAVILATGAEAVKPRAIPGVDLANVFTTTDILSGKVKMSDRKVAVVGSGLTGLETAEMLVVGNNKLTIIEMADELAPGAWFQHKLDILPKLEVAGAEFITSAKLQSIANDGLTIEHVKTKKKEKLNFDAIVLSLGSRPVNRLEAELKNKFSRLFVVGDAGQIGTIAKATSSAYEVAVNKIK